MEFDKKYYKIKDVAILLDVPQSTLRFWESEFKELNPMRSKTGIRYYTPEDIKLLQVIKFLVKTRGVKIDIAKKELSSNQKNLSKKLQIIDNLEFIKSDLQNLLDALKKIETYKA